MVSHDHHANIISVVKPDKHLRSINDVLKRQIKYLHHIFL